MSEKTDILYDALKRENAISLYSGRVMIYDEGLGEIQFWRIGENENFLTLYKPGCTIYFDGWNLALNDEGKATGLNLKIGENVVSYLMFPSEKKLIANHNSFYVEQFTLKMSDALIANTAEKGDWINKEMSAVVDGIKHNLGKLKKNADKETFQKSCVDLANYAMMGFYLEGKSES